MPLSLNEIRKRASEFSKEWENVSDERAEAQTFWNDFFNVFGVSRKRVATFEKPVKKADGHQGFIDLLWKRVVLVEHKSRGKDLSTAFAQAKDYFPGLKDEELPRYIIVSNFMEFKLFDLISNTEADFKLKDLYKNINLFGFISGYQQRVYKDQEPVNIKAAELMGDLHDALLANGYSGHELEVMLVRLLFCLFAEDTTIFDKQQFTDYIELRTKEDGSDLGIHIAQLFQTLNTPENQRQKNLDEQVAAFPYVNGSLFAEPLHLASFDSLMRTKLLTCCYFDWSVISPAIFGSMFQSVMNPKERRNLGAHYTSEKNIMKLIQGLFLDDLRQEFETVKTNKARLQKFHDKLSQLKFLDPACGSGNFLIITYRELRLLELEILNILFKGQLLTDVSQLSKIDVDAFYGIEYEEFASQIATVAMWLIDHQMNMRLSAEFGEYYKRLPLKKSATIVHGNALRMDWQSLLNPVNSIDIEAEHANIFLVKEPEMPFKSVNVKAKSYTITEGEKILANTVRFDYIMGNPPFVGHQWRSKEQAEDMEIVWKTNKRAGRLDYVTAWFKKASDYATLANTQIGFVTTNSIVQGEQPGILWHDLFSRGVVINFAHRTFVWSNEAKGIAHVHVVIIGFSHAPKPTKFIYHYEKNEPLYVKAKNINSYLLDAPEITLQTRGRPFFGMPEMFKGSQPTDGGNLLLSPDEAKKLIAKYPQAEKWVKPFVGASEFLNNGKRFCLWLKDSKLSEVKQIPEIMLRLELVKEVRLKSPTPSVIEFAKVPYLFTQDRHPSTDYISVPEVSSENRQYIPIGFLNQEVICSNKLQIIPNGTLFMFGILHSAMHMAWVKTVCGRMKSDYSYAPFIYNNFPWPQDLPKQKVAGLEKLANQILKVRARYPESSLADLYDPLTMPPDLVRAHQDLDKYVDTCYRPQPFDTEMQRIEFLFELYQKYTQPLFGADKKKRGSKKDKQV